MFAVTTDTRRRSLASTATARFFAAALVVLCAQASASEGAADSNAVKLGRALVAQALAYEHGEGVPKDPLKAAALYCTAARDGDPEAQFSLGWMYANGRGVAHDEAMAASLFALAAAAGHVEAVRMRRFVGDDRGALPDCMRPPEPPPDTVAEVEPDPFAELPPGKQKIANQVLLLAPRYALDPRLALAIIAVESNFEPAARSPKNARGLMQLIPETASRFNVRNVYDVKENLRGGLAYLRWLLAYYEGQVALAVAAYNAGEAAVDKYRGIPPFPETRDYVRRVRRLFRNESHAFDPRVVAPSPMLTEGSTPR
jgi:soluble lytic murein transglycosylase-like protein